MTRSMEEMTSPDVAAQIRRSPLAILPFGSVEQHGPHLPNGTDSFAAELIAGELAERLDGLLVPFGPYGVTPIHAGHPGTISVSRQTFEALLRDISSELMQMGVSRLVFVNWHEGNIASIDAVATEIQDQNPGVYVVTSHACYVAERMYAPQGGELTHGGGIETLAMLAHDPALVDVSRAEGSTRPEQAVALDAMRRDRETRGYITDVTEIDPDGWYGNPSWAEPDLATGFAANVAAEIASEVRKILELRDGAT